MNIDWHKARLPSFSERLEEFTIPEPNSGCLLWCGATTEKGYGRIMLNGLRRMVHQFVWENTHGPMPSGHVVRHQCDVPSCVRIDHLLIGLQRDNVADMDARGRRGMTEARDEWGRFARTEADGDSGESGIRESKNDVPKVLK